MQITIALPGQPETAEPFTLRAFASETCPLCENRSPVWFADPASNAAMNPDASPIGAPCTCAPCLNTLLSEGEVAIVEIDPDAF